MFDTFCIFRMNPSLFFGTVSYRYGMMLYHNNDKAVRCICTLLARNIKEMEIQTGLRGTLTDRNLHNRVLHCTMKCNQRNAPDYAQTCHTNGCNEKNTALQPPPHSLCLDRCGQVVDNLQECGNKCPLSSDNGSKYKVQVNPKLEPWLLCTY